MYIGDYASLVTAGSNFFGMFSVLNYPDRAKFMPGVKFQREVDWTNNKLYADATHTVGVRPSIDPFFFEIDSSICNKGIHVCGICHYYPLLCYPLTYDPNWLFKCPACAIQILANPGDEFKLVTVFNSLGEKLGELTLLREPIVRKGVAYRYGISVKPQEGVGYVLRAEPTSRAAANGIFRPAYFVRRVEVQPGIE